MTYSEKLRSPLWQKKRLEILSRDNFECLHCGSGEKTLNVHHGYYQTGLNPWDYDPDTLHTLCEDCHKQYEEIKTGFEYELAHLVPTERVKVMLKVSKEIIQKDYPELKKHFQNV